MDTVEWSSGTTRHYPPRIGRSDCIASIMGSEAILEAGVHSFLFFFGILLTHPYACSHDTDSPVTMTLAMHQKTKLDLASGEDAEDVQLIQLEILRWNVYFVWSPPPTHLGELGLS